MIALALFLLNVMTEFIFSCPQCKIGPLQMFKLSTVYRVFKCNGRADMRLHKLKLTLRTNFGFLCANWKVHLYYYIVFLYHLLNLIRSTFTVFFFMQFLEQNFLKMYLTGKNNNIWNICAEFLNVTDTQTCFRLNLS